MKKISFLFLMLLVSGCGRWNDNYQPQLSSQPKDNVKYENDRKSCIVFANTESKRLGDSSLEKDRVKNTVAGTIPILGLGMLISEQSDPNHIDNTPMGIADRCMAKKGYDVFLEKHCC